MSGQFAEEVLSKYKRCTKTRRTWKLLIAIMRTLIRIVVLVIIIIVPAAAQLGPCEERLYPK